MPRPSDTYTHAQFEQVQGTGAGERTDRCIHCKAWQGSSKVLSRKKNHLQNCPQYQAWRVAGNGQELAPRNPYNATGRRVRDDMSSSSHGSVSNHGAPPLLKRSNVKTSEYFDEFYDASLGEKCMRVRCRSCGFVRARNATRQVEHLNRCQAFLASPQGIEFLAARQSSGSERSQHDSVGYAGGVHMASSMASLDPSSSMPAGAVMGDEALWFDVFPQLQQPTDSSSLTQHLLEEASTSLLRATQHTFLAHAGCGTLSQDALMQWMAQISHVSRLLGSFIGSLLGKVRLPALADLHRDPIWRCFDLLCSAVSNCRTELEFLDAMKRKYDLDIGAEEPALATRGLMDLLTSVASPSSTLLEGFVLLWGIEKLFHTSFAYAGTFVHNNPPLTQQQPQQNQQQYPQKPRDQASFDFPMADNLPADLLQMPQQTRDGHRHINALHEAFIENWGSENFGQFVTACKFVVDEMALTQAKGDGKADILACKRILKQAIWLWEQMFPNVTGMNESTSSGG